MNIKHLVTQYVAFRRALGEQCKTREIHLRAFCRVIGPRTPIKRIRLKDVNAFLAGTGPFTNTWFSKYTALKGAFRFAINRGKLATAPLPTDLPKPLPTVTPYIYSREEIRRLLDAIPTCRRLPARIAAPTMRAILLLLYGAGLRRGEVLRLTAADVDLPNSLLTIRYTKFFKSRLVPISRDLGKVLSDYAAWRSAKYPAAGAHSNFFLGEDGAALPPNTLGRAFQRLRKYAGVRRSDTTRFQPRMHDLRHTFAVHRLTEWYRQGADAQRLVYHLSVYLGHVSLVSTQVYLTMTPELLREASTRFERYAFGEDIHA
jgi:integrase/recombinase XerD